MAKITWLGEDDLHDGAAGPSFCIGFDGIKFPKGQPVEVTNPDFINRARKNQFFEVEGEDEFVSIHPEPKRRGRPLNVKTEENV
jgi:hypothetical protein